MVQEPEALMFPHLPSPPSRDTEAQHQMISAVKSFTDQTCGLCFARDMEVRSLATDTLTAYDEAVTWLLGIPLPKKIMSDV